MDKQQANQRIEKLKKEIERHRFLYHVLDQEEISEAARDSLKHELVRLEQEFPEFLTADSPSQRVAGKALAKFVKVRHSKPVLSLQDYFSPEELGEWQQRNEKLLGQSAEGYYCELKMDGLTVILTYKNGIFFRGATRGDGIVGEDVTQNLKTMESIPLKLTLDKIKNLPEIIEVRGEVVMSKSNFAKLNALRQKQGLPLFANPRNCAAGSIRQLESQVAASRKLDCYVFELITDLGQQTHSQSHELMRQLGFKTSGREKIAADLSEVVKYLKTWEKKRTTLDFNTDGAVIVVDDLRQEKILGSVGKSERWMAAFKFPAEQATTVVKDIVVQVGRTGALTPIAVLEPVLVAGSTVSRATLHNEDEIKRLDVRIGDTVVLQKAGDIIPDIVQVLPKLRTGKEKKFVFPKKCPICNQPVVRPEGEVAHYCSNKSCYAREIQGLIHFVSKKAFNIDGLGDKIIEQLVSVGLISSAADIFTLKTSDLEQLERFAPKSAANLVSAVAAAKSVSLEKFIYALGIRHVGEQTAIDLAQHFGSLDKIMTAGLDQLEAVSDVGQVVADSIMDWFTQSKNRQLIEKLQKVGVEINKTRVKQVGKLPGQTFVITGTLSHERAYYEQLIRQNGGKTSSSVSSQTDYLLAGENAGSKLDKAKKMGVQVIDEKQWQKIIA